MAADALKPAHRVSNRALPQAAGAIDGECGVRVRVRVRGRVRVRAQPHVQ